MLEDFFPLRSQGRIFTVYYWLLRRGREGTFQFKTVKRSESMRGDAGKLSNLPRVMQLGRSWVSVEVPDYRSLAEALILCFLIRSRI